MLVLGQIIITKKPLNILLPLKTEYLYNILYIIFI